MVDSVSCQGCDEWYVHCVEAAGLLVHTSNQSEKRWKHKWAWCSTSFRCCCRYRCWWCSSYFGWWRCCWCGRRENRLQVCSVLVSKLTLVLVVREQEWKDEEEKVHAHLVSSNDGVCSWRHREIQRFRVQRRYHLFVVYCELLEQRRQARNACNRIIFGLASKGPHEFELAQE